MEARQFDFTYTDQLGRPAKHLVAVFNNDSWTTIMVTDRSEENECVSVTTSIECLVEGIVASFDLDPNRIVVIEHYDDLAHESWDLVKLERRRDGSFTNPEWKSINKEEVDKWCGIEEVQI